MIIARTDVGFGVVVSTVSTSDGYYTAVGYRGRFSDGELTLSGTDAILAHLHWLSAFKGLDLWKMSNRIWRDLIDVGFRTPKHPICWEDIADVGALAPMYFEQVEPEVMQ